MRVRTQVFIMFLSSRKDGSAPTETFNLWVSILYIFNLCSSLCVQKPHLLPSNKDQKSIISYVLELFLLSQFAHFEKNKQKTE